MQGYNFTDHVRTVLMRARDSALRLGHEFVTPDHLLLGIVREGEGVAATAITGLGVTLPVLGTALEARMEPGAGPTPGLDIPYASRAKSVLELAMMEARDLNHVYVGTEHLLLGILREGRSTAAAVLVEHGLPAERVRGEVLRLLGADQSNRPAAEAWIGQYPSHAAIAGGTGARNALLVSVLALFVAITALIVALSR